MLQRRICAWAKEEKKTKKQPTRRYQTKKSAAFFSVFIIHNFVYNVYSAIYRTICAIQTSHQPTEWLKRQRYSRKPIGKCTLLCVHTWPRFFAYLFYFLAFLPSAKSSIASIIFLSRLQNNMKTQFRNIHTKYFLLHGFFFSILNTSFRLVSLFYEISTLFFL